MNTPIGQRRGKAGRRSAVREQVMETVGLGFYFEDLPVGRRFRTIGRTVTEADIVGFQTDRVPPREA